MPGIEREKLQMVTGKPHVFIVLDSATKDSKRQIISQTMLHVNWGVNVFSNVYGLKAFLQKFRGWGKIDLCRIAMGQGPSTIVADVVPINSEWRMFPGSHRSDFCLCASGGGSRALSHTMGVYRALQELGIMKQLDGISSVSGGTWASSIYMFAKEFEGKPIDTATMLGKSTKPEDLTMSELNKDAAPMSRGITKGNSSRVFWERAATMRDNQVWARVVADIILQPFGLDSFDKCLAADEEEVKRIMTENPELRAEFLTPRSDRPKLFVMNGALLAPYRYEPDSDTVVSFQMSPDYTGSPFYPKAARDTRFDTASYDPAPLCCLYPCWRSSITLTVGGGMIETFAFGGDAPSPEAQKGGKVPVPRPEECFSLAHAVGISSYAPASAFSNRLITTWFFNIREKYWPITQDAMAPQEEKEFSFGDGGSIDNSGLLPLLQRRTTKVIWIASSYRPLSSTYDFENATLESFDPDAAEVVEQLYSCFGYGVDNKDRGFFYSNNQVFKKSLLLPICQKLAALKAAGKPAVIKETLDVLPNDYWGIVGGYPVSLVLIYLDEVKDFQKRLPLETQEEIAKGPSGALANYPIYKTTNNNNRDILGLSTPQVNLLAAQGEYAVKQNAELIKQMVAERRLPTIFNNPSLSFLQKSEAPGH